MYQKLSALWLGSCLSQECTSELSLLPNYSELVSIYLLRSTTLKNLKYYKKFKWKLDLLSPGWKTDTVFEATLMTHMQPCHPDSQCQRPSSMMTWIKFNHNLKMRYCLSCSIYLNFKCKALLTQTIRWSIATSTAICTLPTHMLYVLHLARYFRQIWVKRLFVKNVWALSVLLFTAPLTNGFTLSSATK